ncbi:MAG TPA: methyltransferase domain-containing protein [Chloroflexia bacterium]|nr:methyltransferase domain-containing protein [Chloroflexia bacterium]
MKIGPNDLVLDVGSGHSPNPRSDILCDRYIEDDTERGGSILVDRPLIVADGHNLPFKDKAFDYVIASHIIEHMDDPARFCSELARVAKRGFIASPTELAEHMFYWSFHKWYVNKLGNRLVLHPKVNVPNIFGDLFDYFYEYNPWFARFHRSVPDLFWMEYEWDGVIQIEIRDTSPLNLDDPRVLKRMAIPRETPVTSLKRTAVTLADEFLPRAAKKLITKARRQKRSPARKVNLESILACPACSGDVKVLRDAVKCVGCSRVYPIERGFPMMLLDQDMRYRPPDDPSPTREVAAMGGITLGN